MTNEINNWINDPQRDYAVGVRLLELHCTNPHLVRYFANRSPRFAMGELVAELRRIQPKAKEQQTFLPVAAQTTKPNLPKVVDAAKQLVHDCWVKLSQFLRDLFDVGEGNSEKEVAARLLLLNDREPYIERYNSVYEAKEAFFAGKITEKQLQEVVDGKTIDAVLHPPKPKKETPLRSLSDLTLAKAIKAAKQCITRYNNQLRYQHDTAQRYDNPMPQCPRRTKIEKLLADKQSELATLEAEYKRRDL